MTTRRNPPRERCGKQCRSEKPPYGWICGRCEHELDAYYIKVIALRGGDIVPPGPAGAVPGPFY